MVLSWCANPEVMEKIPGRKNSYSRIRFEHFWRRMRDLNPRDFRLRVFETRALGRYANPPRESYGLNEKNLIN